MNEDMDQSYMKIKKGQQISMSIAQPGDSSDILDGMELEVIDLRKDWNDILNTIHDHQHIQRAMEKAYQDFQEGHKLKDFKYRNGIEGAWSFSDIHQGKFPCSLSTTNWLYDYEDNEWHTQANSQEINALKNLKLSIELFQDLSGYANILSSLVKTRDSIYLKYPPRDSNPESWRPEQSAYWASLWMKILAKTHYTTLTDDWRIVSNENHSLVAGITKDNNAYLLDIILLTSDKKKILAYFNKA